jgi:hypothetical protein
MGRAGNDARAKKTRGADPPGGLKQFLNRIDTWLTPSGVPQGASAKAALDLSRMRFGNSWKPYDLERRSLKGLEAI